PPNWAAPWQPGPPPPPPPGWPGAYPPGQTPPGAWGPGAWPPPTLPPPTLPPPNLPPSSLPPGVPPPGWPPGIPYAAGPDVLIAEPRPHGMALAPLGRRFVARLIDIAAVLVLSAAVTAFIVRLWWQETSAYWSTVWDTLRTASTSTSTASSDLPSMTGR